MVKPRQYPLPDFGDVIFLLILNFLLFVVPNFVFQDGSIGWHLVTGRFILDTHTIPHQDLMSYTFPHAPWVAYEWLFDLFAASVEKLAGLNGLAVGSSSIIALVFLLLYERCRRLGMNFLLSAVLISVAALASSVHWLARPHIFTFLGVYIFSTTLESFRRQEISKVRLLATLSACMAFWVNLHPGFLYGFALTVIYLACELVIGLCVRSDTARGDTLGRAKWFGFTLGALFVCSLANPYGTRLYGYISHFLRSSQVLDVLQEYESPIFHGALQPTCLEIVFLFLALGLALTRKRPSFPQFITCLAFAHLALSSQRHVPEFIIVTLPLIADLFSSVRLPFSIGAAEPEPNSWLQQIGDRLRQFNQSFDQNEAACQMHIVSIASVAILLFASFNSGTIFGQPLLNSGFDKVKMPSDSLSYIRDNKLSPQQGFNYDNWGGYIRYCLGIPVFIDDRLDFYGKSFFVDYSRVVHLLPGWSDLLDRYRINWVLYPKNAPLSRQLKEDPRWKLVCEDQSADLFIRR